MDVDSFFQFFFVSIDKKVSASVSSVKVEFLFFPRSSSGMILLGSKLQQFVEKKISVEHPVHVLPLSVPSSSSSPFVGFTLYLYFSLWKKIASEYYPHTRTRVIYLIISVMLKYNYYENQINLNIGNISGTW